MIIGAGAIGLSIARNLPKSLSIAIIDRNKKGMRASYAAGGMLGAQNEFTRDSPLYRLSMEGRAMLPGVIAQLEEETGIDIHLQQHGLIKYQSTVDDNDQLMEQYHFLKSMDDQIQLLDSRDMKQIIPSLSPSCHTKGILIPDDGQIDVSCYIPALKTSLTHVDIFDEEVISVAEGYTVQTNKETYQTEKLVIAGGAWSGDLLEQLGISLPISGMRGEVCYMYHPDLKLKQSIFGTNGCYIVPKYGHHYLIGATSCPDCENFVSDEGKAWLKLESERMIPSLKNGNVVRHYSGVRPYTKDHQLYMDECLPGLFLATGHYRNGILLSAITGYYMAELITGTKHDIINHFSIKQEA